MSRLQTRAIFLFVAVFVAFAFLSIGFRTDAAIDRLKWVTDRKAPGMSINSIAPVRTGRTVVFERSVHDEVSGSLAYSLGLVGVQPILNINMRHGFEDVLRASLPWEPEFVSVAGNPSQMKKWLDEDSIQNLVLTTCSDSLRVFRDEITASSAHVFCVVHHSGGGFKNALSQFIKPFAEQKRITLIALGGHVHQSIVGDLREWADDDDFPPYTEIPVETLVPVFEFPPNRTFHQRDIFPTKVTIQGNIERGRRNYDKIFEDLIEKLDADPKPWGYRAVVEEGKNKTYVRNEDDPNAFELHLLGQRNKEEPMILPTELENVIQIHEGLKYTDFYALAADSDLLLPAFKNRGTFLDTASSTMGTAMIVRTPVLVSERHTAAYTYIQGPANVHRGVAEPEVDAIARLRQESFSAHAAATAAKNGFSDADTEEDAWPGYDGSGKIRPPPAVQAREWRTLLDGIYLENAGMWARHLQPPRSAKDTEHLAEAFPN